MQYLCIYIYNIYNKISFGGIPNSRNGLFLQIFLKRAAKQSAGNSSAGFQWVKWPQILLNLAWLYQSLPDLLRNLLRNPVGPDLALHQSPPGTFSGIFSRTLLNRTRQPPTSSPEPSPEPCWTWPGSAPNPLRHQGFLEPSPEPSPEPCCKGPDPPKPPRPSPEPAEPSPEPCWTSPGACTSAHQSYSGLKTPLAAV